MLGAGGLGNFSSTHIHPQNGQCYPLYVFPKREACLMAMSYSYDLQVATAYMIPTGCCATLQASNIYDYLNRLMLPDRYDGK